MTRIGYSLSSEEFGPRELVALARRAEECGFEYALISDHFHPWTSRQGQSPFVWSVIGGIAQATERLELGTGVTCPTMRIHPAIVAHAAATAAAMMPGRFFLGVGAGENLNEHVLGEKWPPPPVRLEMLEEAIEVMRLLWQGGRRSHRGRYFTVEDARLYTLPEEPPRIVMAAGGKRATELAGRVADGLCAISPDPDLVARFRSGGADRRPCYGQLTVCYAPTVEEARRAAHEWWPNAAVGDLAWELRDPRQFELAAELVTEDDVASAVLCSPDPDEHAARIQEFADAGFDHVYVHQVGPDQEGFFRFYEREILPRFRA